MNGGDAYVGMEVQYIRRHHRHETRDNQCTSAMFKHIKAPVHLVCFSDPYDLCLKFLSFFAPFWVDYGSDFFI